MLLTHPLFFFAFTIFIGAFLLFQVQPLIGKYILPWFGGSPGVWTTCMLFFQMLLLGGYAYAYGLSRLAPKKQALIHAALLVLALVFIPVIPAQAWKPTGDEAPVSRILLLLGATVGLPYFVLSSTGPLLQHWFGLRHPGRSPYRLYALSNVGSLLALISYPFFFEVRLSRDAQAWLWSCGLAVFAVACGICAYSIYKKASPPQQSADSHLDASRPTAGERGLWVALPAIASLLLLAVTNKLCVDVAVFPFLWVLPLSLYLLSFILCFDHPRWYHRGFFAALFTVGLASVAYLIAADTAASIGEQIAGYSLTLFAACMIAHGELYRLRPTPTHATSFYLAIAAGGALGGLFVAVVAPMVFDQYYELQLGLCLLPCLMGLLSFWQRDRTLPLGIGTGLVLVLLAAPALRIGSADGVGAWLQEWWKIYDALARAYWVEVIVLASALFLCLLRASVSSLQGRLRSSALPILLAVALGVLLLNLSDTPRGARVVASERNFYGALRVMEFCALNPLDSYRVLHNGSTLHGLQFMNFPRRALPTSYYGFNSGVGLAFLYLPREEGSRNVGLVGLGTGTVLSYGWPGDEFRVYEINPEAVRLAKEQFHYFDQSSGKIELVMGDARLSMERERDSGFSRPFDLLVLDAFNSDSIPIHLLTVEALQLYIDLLAKDGIIAIHTSNRYLDLDPVVVNLAKHFGLYSAVIVDGSKDDWISPSSWVLLTRDASFFRRLEIQDSVSSPSSAWPDVGLWTDDHASLFPILR